MNNSKLEKKIFGYNKNEVEKYLQELEQSQQERLDAVQISLEAAKLAKKRAAEKLESLQVTKERLHKPVDFMELALIRAKESAALLNEKALKESEEVMQGVKEKNENYEKKIINIMNEMRRIKAYFESALHQIHDITEEKKDETSDAARDNIRKLVTLNKAVLTEKPNPNVPSEKEIINLAQDSQLTADGMPNPDIQTKKEASPKEQFKRIFEDVAKIVVDAERPLTKTEEEQAAASEEAEHPAISPEAEEITESVKGSFWEEEEQASTPPSNYIEEKPAEPSIPVPSVKQEKPEEAEPAGAKPYSPAVAAQITNIRQKYIVGKLAGSDVFNSGGQKIIGKGEVITPEIVAVVESEGKLPELIVNMILPGMEV